MQATVTHTAQRDRAVGRLSPLPFTRAGLRRNAARIGQHLAGVLAMGAGLVSAAAFAAEAVRAAEPVFFLVHWPLTLLAVGVGAVVVRVALWR